MIDKKAIKDFEEEVAQLYRDKRIRGPIHLRDGHEDQLIKIFKEVRPNDYKFATWANHAEGLLSGIPTDKILERILAGDSMAMSHPEYRFYTSAIVGGILPIATGVAHSIKRKGEKDRVWCFIGDMTFRTGIAHESIMYSIGHDLPITFVVGDNGKSVCTDTEKTCGTSIEDLYNFYWDLCEGYGRQTDIRLYHFDSKWPHSGQGDFISF